MKRAELEKMLFEIQDENKNHFDVLTGKLKYLTPRDFTLLLTD